MGRSIVLVEEWMEGVDAERRKIELEEDGVIEYLQWL